MSKLDWGPPGTRFYETGVDNGVLYVADAAVAWPGLVSVSESPSGGEAKPFYIDGIKYVNVSSAEEFEFTIQAFYSPPEFDRCDGISRIQFGLYATQQRKVPFGFSYRTRIGNDVDGADHAYKIHIVYNALADPTDHENSTMAESTEASIFSWAVTTTPTSVTGFKPTAHLVIDSRTTDSIVLATIEDILYGTDSDEARLPLPTELYDIFDLSAVLRVIDNGDGSFTVTGPDSAITMLETTKFQIAWPSAVVVDANSYTLSSL